MEIKENILQILSNLPSKPGVYKYFNKNNKIIYIGKAKNLKNRIKSYFNNNNNINTKTILLVQKTCNIEYIITKSEYEALLLENNLIKEYKPQYNILLKDDKTYPFLCIKNEAFPRVFVTRNVIKDGSKYFGPFSSLKIMYTILDFFKEIFPIRSCNLNLNDENIAKKKYDVCLEYHIKNCMAPCVAYQDKNDYDNIINQIQNILNGNFKDVYIYLKNKMLKNSEIQEYEIANEYKKKIELLQKYESKAVVVNTNIDNTDIFSIISDNESAYINFAKIVKGCVVMSNNIEIIKKLDESNEEILTKVIYELRAKFQSNSNTILVSEKINYHYENNINIIVPLIGDKKKLIDFSLLNARQYKVDRLKTIEIVDPERHQNRILENLKKDLQLDEIPIHIECFDNSNIQGTNPVAACVVFKNAKPSKSDYRKFNIKTVEGPNDFASMEEIVYRRYKRLLDENQSLPQLIIIDGGKGQLSSAVKSLKKLNIFGKVAIIGIAKRLEEIFFPNDNIPLYLDKKSESLKLIQHLRNEAHRFGITFHRDQRSKNAFQSELESINGIGDKTIVKLINHFGSIKNIKEATLSQLNEIIDLKKSAIIRNHFANK